MALVVVLAFSTVLLILGSAYLNSFKQGRGTTERQLDQIQMEYFAQGIQRIALMKFKKHSPAFYRAYRYQMAKDRGESLTNNYSPTPLEKFHGQGHNVLQHSSSEDFKSPLKIASYSTVYTMSKSDEFNRDLLQITVYVQLTATGPVSVYRASFEASRTLLL